MIIRSRVVLPVSGPPIEDGALFISGDRIVAVGPWHELQHQANEAPHDLGDSILLPGLVNAHCHLDYTKMAGMISPPRSFPDWVKAMLALKAEWSYSNYAESWTVGAQMLLHTGTTTVADIEAVPELLPDAWGSVALRVTSFLELTCVRSGRSPFEVLHLAMDKVENCHSSRHRLLLSPHALYSTNRELLEVAAAIAHERKWILTMHVAESEPEFEMYRHQRGPFFNWLKPQRDMSDCDGISPIQQLDKCGVLSSNFLAVHVNYLANGDAHLLAQRGSSVVHCPRSHAYFCHHAFPYDELSKAGVNICLGTDSLASVITSRRQPVELNMFDEMRRFAETNPHVSPASILAMATIHGARALGMKGEIGELAPNTRADIVAIPLTGKASEAYDAVLRHSGNVSASMIDGQWAIPPKA